MHLQLRTGGFFVSAKFYCPHALADGTQCIQIREKTLEFSSTVLSTMSPYLVNARPDALNPTRPISGGLPIRQNRQLPKARHGAGARPVQRKARKMFY